jgi:hypothetical protein
LAVLQADAAAKAASIAELKAKLLAGKLHRRTQALKAKESSNSPSAPESETMTPVPDLPRPTALPDAALTNGAVDAPMPLASTSKVNTSTAAPPKRGVKRPSAIDLADQPPSSLSSSALFSAPKRFKRSALAPAIPRVFVVDLDDSDEEGEDSSTAATAKAQQDADLQRQLAQMMKELEEGKAKIAAKEARRLARQRIAAAGVSASQSPALSPSPSVEHATPVPAPPPPAKEQPAQPVLRSVTPEDVDMEIDEETDEDERSHEGEFRLSRFFFPSFVARSDGRPFPF